MSVEERASPADGSAVVDPLVSRLTDAGPPREVYFTDFDSAEPSDEVCDVAYPIR